MARKRPAEPAGEKPEFRSTEDPRSARWDPLLEVIITVALGLAAVLAATSVYLSERSDHEAAQSFNGSIRLVNEAATASTQATQVQAEDHALFAQFASASILDRKAGRYLLDNAMSPRLRRIVVWWADREDSKRTGPFTDDNPYFTHAQADRAADLREQSQESYDEAKDHQDDAASYILVEVILATSLFLYGIAGVTRRFRIRIGTLAAGTAIFLVASVLLVAV